MKRGDDARNDVILSADLLVQIRFEVSEMFESLG
jgi:hypothetical protein